jgi:hypothetical protein
MKDAIKKRNTEVERHPMFYTTKEERTYLRPFGF